MADPFKARTMKRKNVKGLALSAPAPAVAPPPPSPPLPLGLPPNSTRSANTNGADTLEIGVEFRPDWRSEDLEVIKDLGAGNGGTVSKVRHTGWNVIMARKIIHVEAKKEVRKRIVRELQIMHECNSPYIVSFYGAFMNESGDVTMCMEYADCGSLDFVSKTFGPVRVDVLGKIAEAVLGGLKYLYLAHRIMHRDIKPSNILVNSAGQIKLCDFGVSSELENSVADTFVGTGTYMAPERIQGSPYTVKSDVWSVGLTLMELAIGKFPFSIGGDGNEDEDPDDEDAAGPQGILDLLQQIVLEPAPKLPKSDAFPSILEDVIAKCLMKTPNDRPTPVELYDQDPFLQAAKRTPVDLERWATSMMEQQKRKSHLPLPGQGSPGIMKVGAQGEQTPRVIGAGSATPRTAALVGGGGTPRGGEAGSMTGSRMAEGMAGPRTGGNGTPRTAVGMGEQSLHRSMQTPPQVERGNGPVAASEGGPAFLSRSSSAQVTTPGYARDREAQYASREPQYAQREAQPQPQIMALPIRQAPSSHRQPGVLRPATSDNRNDHSRDERGYRPEPRTTGSYREDQPRGDDRYRTDGSLRRAAPPDPGYVR